MLVLSDRQKSVLRYVGLDDDMPVTVREIAQALHRPESSVRAALVALERHGCVERAGVALTGGQTWRMAR